jgi:hypothetical protein
MRITFNFDRHKPFADVPARDAHAGLVRSYCTALAAAFRVAYPDVEFTVRAIDEPCGDVEIAPDPPLTDEERLVLALELKRIAHRLADEMFAGHFRDLEVTTLREGDDGSAA